MSGQIKHFHLRLVTVEQQSKLIAFCNTLSHQRVISTHAHCTEDALRVNLVSATRELSITPLWRHWMRVFRKNVSTLEMLDEVMTSQEDCFITNVKRPSSAIIELIVFRFNQQNDNNSSTQCEWPTLVEICWYEGQLLRTPSNATSISAKVGDSFSLSSSPTVLLFAFFHFPAKSCVVRSVTSLQYENNKEMDCAKDDGSIESTCNVFKMLEMQTVVPMRNRRWMV